MMSQLFIETPDRSPNFKDPGTVVWTNFIETRLMIEDVEATSGWPTVAFVRVNRNGSGYE